GSSLREGWGAAGRGWEGGGRVVAKIDFADGFDAPEPLAWGLTPAQLGTVVAGAVLAYLCLHAPLPRIVAVPLALVAASAGLNLALARRDGRTLISWAAAAARFWTRPRRGLLVVVQAAQPPDPTSTQDSTHRREPVLLDREDAVRPSPARLLGEPGDEVETSRRVPLVLLPEPLTAARERGAEAVPAGGRPLPLLRVAGAALLGGPAAPGPEARGGEPDRVPERCGSGVDRDGPSACSPRHAPSHLLLAQRRLRTDDPGRRGGGAPGRPDTPRERVGDAGTAPRRPRRPRPHEPSRRHPARLARSDRVEPRGGRTRGIGGREAPVRPPERPAAAPPAGRGT